MRHLLRYAHTPLRCPARPSRITAVQPCPAAGGGQGRRPVAIRRPLAREQARGPGGTLPDQGRVSAGPRPDSPLQVLQAAEAQDPGLHCPHSETTTPHASHTPWRSPRSPERSPRALNLNEDLTEAIATRARSGAHAFGPRWRETRWPCCIPTASDRNAEQSLRIVEQLEEGRPGT